MTKTVFIVIRPFEHNLEGVSRARLLLKQGQRRRKLFRCILDFCNKPRFLVPRDKEIDLSLFLVANVKKIKLAQPEISPHPLKSTILNDHLF